MGLKDQPPKQGKVEDVWADVGKRIEDLSVWIGKVEESRNDWPFQL